MNNIRLKISPPWVTVINKIEALFDGDPQIACNVDTGSKHPSITLACNNGDKVTALQHILPTEFEFGNVKLAVNIDGVPSNRVFKTKKELFEVVFEKNPAFAYVVSPTDDGYSWFSMTYVVFKNCVVQFFNDNLNDCHGIISTLYQDIAEEILIGEAAEGVYFNTDIKKGTLGEVGKPIEEWL